LTDTPRPVALITGGARRVGRATARSLAARGCDLILTYRSSLDEAQHARDELARDGTDVELAHLDLGDPESVERVSGTIARERDRLDVLVHNASVYNPSPLEGLEHELIRTHFQVNAFAPLVLTARLAPLLARSVLPIGGSVVCMCDIHAMGRPRKGFAAYSMSKAALVEMVRSLARDLAPEVRVAGVAPGVVAWPEQGHESDEASQQAYLKRVPLARSGTPEDAADTVRWLALDAGYITGQIVRVDGGRFLA